MKTGPIRTLEAVRSILGIGSARRRTIERILAAVGSLLLMTQLVVVVARDDPGARPATVAIEEPTPAPTPTPTPPALPTSPATVPPAETDAPAQAGDAGPSESTAEVDVMNPGDDASGAEAPPPRVETPPPPPPPPPEEGSADREAPPPRDPAHERFASEFPAQEAAGQDARDPATTRWAVLIGINDHYGRTRDNVGSRQDAEDLYQHLIHLGWRSDHIVLLTDRTATRERIEQSIAWLARKTDSGSVGVFHYSGHTKQWHGWDPDRDGEVPDEALWPADNDHMTDRELTDRLAQVRAGRLWIDVGACEAAGYADPGMLQEGRILTFSSQESEKSYEDPSVSNSVWGYYLVERGMRTGEADTDGDGDVTVQEAFHFAAPRAAQRTANGSNGPQHPVIHDRAGAFSLRIPPPPPPEEEPSEQRDEGGDDGDDGDDDGDCGLPICTRTDHGSSQRGSGLLSR